MTGQGFTQLATWVGGEWGSEIAYSIGSTEVEICLANLAKDHNFL